MPNFFLQLNADIKISAYQTTDRFFVSDLILIIIANAEITLSRVLMLSSNGPWDLLSADNGMLLPPVSRQNQNIAATTLHEVETS